MDQDKPYDNEKGVELLLDDVAQKLVAQLESLEIERQRIVSDMQRIKAAVKALRTKRAAAPEGEVARTQRRGRRNRDGTPTLSERVRTSAVRAIEKAGTPLTRVQILQEIRKDGVEVNNADPEKFVGRVLWRSPIFVNDGHGYWIKGRGR